MRIIDWRSDECSSDLFIPVYSRLLDEDRREAGRLAGAVAGLLCALTGVLVVVGVVLAEPLTMLLAPGFDGDTRDLAVDLLRIRSEEHTSELQSLMRISYAVFCLKQKTTQLLTT